MKLCKLGGYIVDVMNIDWLPLHALNKGPFALEFDWHSSHIASRNARYGSS